MSKIIVPHPALGFPTTLSLHYKSYSGWLSKGLPHWDIDKVVLTDSFGRSHSLCRPSTKLSSGSPVRMRLQAGNCELDNQEDYGAYTTQSPASQSAVSTDAPSATAGDSSVQESGLSSVVDGVESAKQRKDIFNLGTSFKLAENQTYPLDQAEELPWQPILVGNSLDKDGNEAEAAESSRSLSDALPGQPATNEIFEPVLKERRLKLNRGRNLQQQQQQEQQDTTKTEEIVEPVLKATTPRAKHGKDLQLPELVEPSVANKTSPTPAAPVAAESPKMMAQLSSGQDEPQMVQLLPFRLGELLQRAERYARETLLPLISVQAPRFFGFNVTPHDRELTGRPGESRKPRYIPRYEEAAFLNGSSSRSKQSAEQTDQAARRNLFKLLRSGAARSDRGRVVAAPQRRPASTAQTPLAGGETASEVNYYTNVLLSSESRAMRPESPDYRPVFIDLPTFRPSAGGTSKSKAARRGRVQQLP